MKFLLLGGFQLFLFVLFVFFPLPPEFSKCGNPTFLYENINFSALFNKFHKKLPIFTSFHGKLHQIPSHFPKFISPPQRTPMSGKLIPSQCVWGEETGTAEGARNKRPPENTSDCGREHATNEKRPSAVGSENGEFSERNLRGAGKRDAFHGLLWNAC